MTTSRESHSAVADSVSDLPTPVVLVDATTMRRNLERVQSAADASGVVVRPHIKTHKSIMLAGLQLSLGACGITVAKIAEAEVMKDGGIGDIFVCYPIVDDHRVDRLLRLAESARVITIVESQEHAALLGGSARRRGLELDVMIDVDTGLGRVGISIDELPNLANTVRHEQGLRLIGISTHEGFVYSIADSGTRIALVEERLAHFAEAGEAIGAGVISAGATPTLLESMRVPGITEVRPGNYIYYDAMQVALGAANVTDCALTVIATVVSVRTDEARAIIDAGSKAFSSDTGAHGTGLLRGYGIVLGRPDIEVVGLSEEHGWLAFHPDGDGVAVGDRLRIVPNHACATVANFDFAYLCEASHVVERFAIDARGALN